MGFVQNPPPFVQNPPRFSRNPPPFSSVQSESSAFNDNHLGVGSSEGSCLSIQTPFSDMLMKVFDVNVSRLTFTSGMPFTLAAMSTVRYSSMNARCKPAFTIEKYVAAEFCERVPPLLPPCGAESMNNLMSSRSFAPTDDKTAAMFGKNRRFLIPPAINVNKNR